MSQVTTSSESRREARLSRHRRATGRRLAIVAAVLVSGVLSILGTIPASAYWQSTGSGVATVSTGTLAAPTNVTVPAAIATTVAVDWTTSVGSTAPTGYFVTRTSGSTTVAACATSMTALISGTSCTDAAAPAGTYTYAVTAVYRSWTATSAPSSSVTVVTPSKLAFASSPTTSPAGTALSVAVVVQSSTGITVPTAGVSVSVTLGANPGSGTLSGTKTATTDATGVATFTGLSIDKIGTGYTLASSSTGLGSATSPAFNITGGPAATFAFTTSAVSGSASATANLGPITVQARDSFGNVAVAPAGGIPLVLSSTSSGTAVFSAVLQGAASPVSIAAGASSATFFYGDTKAGTSQIGVSSAAVPVVSQNATITAGVAAGLGFSSAPVSGTASNSATLGPLTVQLQDAFGNQATKSSSTAVSLSSNSTGNKVFSLTSAGASQSIVSIPANVPTVTFYYGDTLAGSPAITASATGLATAATQNQTITAAAPSQLTFTQQPASTQMSHVMSPVVAMIADRFGNRTTSAAPVSIAVQNNPSLGGYGTLSGTKSRIAVNGIVTFDDLAIEGWWIFGIGEGYTLQVTSPGLAPATSLGFDIIQ